MQLNTLFALFTLIVIVKGAWWAAAVQPVLLGLGAVFSAIDSEVLNVQILQPFVNKQDKTDTEPVVNEEEKKKPAEEKDAA